MKNVLKVMIASLCVFFLSTQVNAQPIDVDNQTTCNYRVKANEGVMPCTMGTGPVAICPPGLTTLSSPPPAVNVTAYGVQIPGNTPNLVGDPFCGFPVIVTLPGGHPNACAGVPTTFEYRSRLLIIR